jgi:hypothetical protein
MPGRDDFIGASWARLAPDVADLEKLNTNKPGALRLRLASAGAELAGGSLRELREELVRVAEQELHRERTVAQVRAQLTVLERTRGNLVAVRATHAQLRAAELATVTSRLQALAQVQRDEAAVAHEVARALRE